MRVSHYYRPKPARQGQDVRERCKRCALERRTVGVLEPAWNQVGGGGGVAGQWFPVLRTLVLFRRKGSGVWSTRPTRCPGKQLSLPGAS